MKTANKMLVNMAVFRYLEMTVTNQNCFHQAFKSR